MPYANGPIHLGHIAGAHLPADIHARWLGMMIGRQNVLFVCGSDDHGSTSELAALKEGKPVREKIAEIHRGQTECFERYQIGLDVYTGTSRPEVYPMHAELCQEFLRRAHAHGLLEKRTSQQWYDPEAKRFLPDRFVRGRCPNPKCDNTEAYSDECDVCGNQHAPTELLSPRSMISSATPEMRATTHWFLDMWAVSDVLLGWVGSKKKDWRPVVFADPYDTLQPSLRFARSHEAAYGEIAGALPAHKKKFGAGGKLVLQFSGRADLDRARAALASSDIPSEVADEWGHRSITRDIAWGIPVPPIDPDLEGKTLYVWPESLIAPVSFTKLALQKRGEAAERYADYWCDPSARVYQFIGQDNVFFYVLMQGAMWLSMQADPHRMPRPGELSMTDVLGVFHLQVEGEKMSKSRGNFYTAVQLLDEKGYTVDQLRYYLALLGLTEKPSDFDFGKLDERNKFLSGPMNAAFERPISAVHSKFGGRVPAGKLVDKIEADTVKMVQRYVKAMERANYASMLYELENYARKINSLFTQYKPHDDRHPLEQRSDALYSSFYVLKNLMIMLYPFVPGTMERVRESLRLPASVFRLDELGSPIPPDHEIGPKQPYFPTVE